MATPASNKGLEVSEESLISLWNKAVLDYEKQLDSIDHEKKRSLLSRGKVPPANTKHDVQAFRKNYRNFEDVLKECPELKEDFVKRRKGTGNADKLRRAFSSLSTEIGLAAGFVKFAVDVAAVPFPPVAPAGMLMSAFTWLWKSFNDVSAEFDQITEFFETIQENFQYLRILEDQLSVDATSEQIKDRIINVFKATLTLCGVAMNKPEHRFEHWAKKTFSGDKSLQNAFKDVDISLLNFFNVLHVSTFKNTSLVVTITQRTEALVRQDEVNAATRHEELSSLMTDVKTLIRESGSLSERKKKESKDPAARRNADLLRIRQELGAIVNQSAYLDDIREYRVKKCHDWFFSQEGKFHGWLKGNSPVFALSGPAGLGKTHLSLSIMDDLEKKQVKYASFFFREYHEDSRNLEKALLSVAFQIAETDNNYCQRILKNLASDDENDSHSIKEMSAEDLWEQLFTAPFKDLGSERLYFLFDGLDAASQDTQEGLSKILRGLDKEKSTIRAVVSTRSAELGSEQAFYSYTLTKQTVTESLRALCTERLKHLPHLKKFHKSVKTRIVQAIVGRADGMLYAKNVLLMLEAIGLEHRVLNEIKILPASLDDLYDRMLRDCRKGRSQVQLRALEDLFTWMAFSMRPLSLQRASEIVKLSALLQGHSNTEEESDVLVIHEEIMGKLSAILEIVRESEDDDDDDTPEKDSEDHDADVADFKLNDDGLRLEFQERRFKDHFTARWSNAFTSHVRIFTMCVHLICKTSKRRDLEDLRRYAADWWGDHAIELDKLYHANAEDLRVAQTFKKGVREVAEGLREVMTNVGNVAKVLEDHAYESYREYRVPENTDWPAVVHRWANLAIESNPNHEGDDTMQWARSVAHTTPAGSIMLSLAQGHARNWWAATEQWRSEEAFRFARDALLLANIPIDGLDTNSKEESFPRVVKSVAEYLLSTGSNEEDTHNVEDDPKACRAIALVLQKDHEDEAASMFERSLEIFGESPLDRYHSHMGLTRTHWLTGGRLRNAQFAVSSIEALEESKQRTAEIKKYKRSALVVLASLEDAWNGDKDEVINLLNTAKDLLPNEPMDGDQLNYLTVTLESRDGLRGLFDRGITRWTKESTDKWLSWAIEEEDWDAISRFEDAWLSWTFQVEEDEDFTAHDAALDRKKREFMERTLKEIIKSSEPTGSSPWARLRLARTYRFVLGDTRKGQYWLRKILNEGKTTVSKQILYDARLDMADIVYGQFRDAHRPANCKSNNRDYAKSELKAPSKTKQDKTRPIHAEADQREKNIGMGDQKVLRESIERNFPRLDQDDLEASLISIPLARIYRAFGDLGKFQRILQGTFNVCVKALNDSDTGNDVASFRLLAMTLSFLEDLEEDAKIALSLQFSEIPPDRVKQTGYDQGSQHTQNDNIAEVSEEASEVRSGDVSDNVHGEKTGPLSEEGTVENADEKTEGDEDPTSGTTEDGDNSDLPSMFDREDIEDNAFVWCDGCNKKYGWWSEHLYHCLICVSCDLCPGCWERRKNANEDRVEGKRIYCGRNHKYMKGPIAGWRGVQAGNIIRRGKSPLNFDQWLNGLKNERWPKAWQKFWTDEYFVRDIM